MLRPLVSLLHVSLLEPGFSLSEIRIDIQLSKYTNINQNASDMYDPKTPEHNYTLFSG